MKIAVIEYATDKKVNQRCDELEKFGFKIIDIVFTHHTANHYVSYAVIKYKLKEI